MDTFRDGGLHGWIAVLGLFIIKVAWNIISKGLGMMLPTLQEQFLTSTWLIGWMFALVDAGLQFSGILATPLKERFGARTVVTVSGLVAGISMIAASFLPSLYAITLTLAVLTGPAVGISFIVTKHLVGGYFSQSITLAYGIASLGDSFAFVAAVPLIQLFLDIYGWRGTMLLLGALFLHLAVCGALIKPTAARCSHNGYEAAHMDEDQEAIKNDKVVPRSCFSCACFTTLNSFAKDTFRLGLLSSLSFWLVVFIVCVWTMVYMAWIIYYVQYSTVYKDFTLEDASHFIVSYGIGRTVACIVICPLINSVQAVSTYTWLAIAQLLVAMYYAVDPWLTSYWAVIANAFMFGNAFAMSSILIDVVIKKVFGKEQMGHALGLLGVASGSTLLLLLYFPGLIYDTIGDYKVVFSLMAGVQLLAVVAALWLHWRQKSQRSSSESKP
ncbi:monocarboxylate transporter 12-like [Asterias amurensis]|uniref:monocarboxylate transporter 12-like n=1 Tax=Asterias amurensis TaxID=7602 RepID=UPI003AB1EB8D